MTDSIVRFEHISMQFPEVLANDDISLTIQKGEVFALIGENGAGKSTLMNALYGLVNPTAGRMFIKNHEMIKHAPTEAISMGVGMVHQHFKLVPSFTVAQNVMLSCEPKRLGFLYDFKKAERRVLQLIEDFGLKLDPQTPVHELSVGLQQRVEILKTLGRGADVLILDEPTAVLTPQETDELFSVIRRIVREKGMTVIIITHKLYEVMAIADRVGVMRAGKLVGVQAVKDVNERTLAGMMVGRDVLLGELTRADTIGTQAIRVDHLQALSDRGLDAVRNVSLTVNAGEIVGIAGVVGNGQSELIEAIAGMRPVRGGTIHICGQSTAGMSPGEIRGLGLAHIPEDRLGTGVSSKASAEDNLIAGRQREAAFSYKSIHLKRRAISEYARNLFKRFDIRGASVTIQASSLSGGNLQKLVLAREFSLDAKALIIAQPTRGVDIGAIEFIHQSIMRKRDEGAAVLLVSADLDELFRLSDRIITMYEGKITGEFRADAIEKADISYYITGGVQEEGERD